MEKEIIEIEKQAISVDKRVQDLTIKSQEEYSAANVFLKTIKELQTKVKDTFGPIIAKAFQAHKEAKAQEIKHLEPLVKAEALIKNKMLDFIREQEKIRQEQEKKLRAEAEKKREEALKKAEEAREQGKEAKAEKYEEKATQIVAPELASTVDRGGVMVKKLYHAEVYDLMVLVKAVAKGKVPLNLIEANMVILNAQARSLKEAMNYPGVKVVAEDNLATARR